MHWSTFKTIRQLLFVKVYILVCQTFGLHLFYCKIYVIEVEWVSISEDNVIGRLEIFSYLVLKGDSNTVLLDLNIGGYSDPILLKETLFA
jgi:hypothetical protein